MHRIFILNHWFQFWDNFYVFDPIHKKLLFPYMFSHLYFKDSGQKAKRRTLKVGPKDQI